MERRYQVFVSSTYEDLQEERAEVMQALLELDCMPSGMELFPAASEEQWNWIKKVIDESDYYLVIIAGRYGSVSPDTKLSFTEMEYRYAVDAGKPTIAFLHENIDAISAGNSERSKVRQNRLAQFRELAESRLCKYWNSPSDLGAKVSRSITQLIKNNPTPGWIRADHLSEASAQEILSLRNEIADLKAQIETVDQSVPEGTQHLAQGSDEIEVAIGCERKTRKINKAGTYYWKKDESLNASVSVSWDEVFSAIAPTLIQPQSDAVVVGILNELCSAHYRDTFAKDFPDSKIEHLRIYRNYFDVIKVQLRALKLIHIDEKEMWNLTPYGEKVMTDLLALKKT